MPEKNSRGSNPKSHGNNPKIGTKRFIVLDDKTWGITKNIGGNYSKGARKMIEVASGQKGILWAVPLSEIDIPRKFNSVPHEHITLWFGCDRSQIEQYIGVIFTAAIVEVAANDRIQAAKVVLPTGIPFKLEISHITLSMTEETAPVESTEMLRSTKGESVEIVTRFSIEFFEFSI